MFLYSYHSTLHLIQLNIFEVVLTFTVVETRINKYLSEIGYCSRRAADKLLEEGRITINGVQPELVQRSLRTISLLSMAKSLEGEKKGTSILH